MNRTKLVRVVCLALALLMAVSIVFPLVFGFAKTKEELAAEKDALKKELDTINSSIKNNKDDITKQEQLKRDYQKQVNTLKSQIELLKTEISNTEGELQAKQEELAAKILALAETKKLFEDRLAAIYMRHNESNLSTLMGVTSFSDALRYSENLQQISLSDTRLMQRLREEQTQLEEQKNAVQADLDGLNASKAELDQKNTEYAQAIQYANNAITQTEAELEANTEAYAEKKAQYEKAQAEWLSFVQASNVGFEFGGGQFSWPIPGYTRLSSDFGVGRWIYGVYDVHRGMDVPAPAGTPIYAAAPGVVSTAAHWSYGTCVKLDHGSGLVTIYGHMSAREVSNGQYVEQGDIIGYVGSTGNSTGNHLHFEVNLNGSPVSAWPYLNG